MNREGPIAWTCICGSGDDGEWHTLACAISNTPMEVWLGSDEELEGEELEDGEEVGRSSA